MATVSTLHEKPTARELLRGIKVIDVDTHVSEWHDLWTSRAAISRTRPASIPTGWSISPT
jgi:hypothetical protein